MMEQRLAATWAGYPWAQYLALPGTNRWLDIYGGDSKASVLAAYRVAMDLDEMKRGLQWD